MAEGFDADERQVYDEAGVRRINQYRCLSSKTGVSEPKSWAVKQFRVQSARNEQPPDPLIWRHLNTLLTLHITGRGMKGLCLKRWQVKEKEETYKHLNIPFI